MKKNFDYFKFSRAQQNGIFVLLLLIVILATVLAFLKKSSDHHVLTDVQIKTIPRAPLKKYYPDEENRNSDTVQAIRSTRLTMDDDKPDLFYFDPNHLPVEQWRKLGLTTKQIKVIKNFESKGGKFRTKTDLKKIYSINDALFLRLEPYIEIKMAGDSTERLSAEKRVAKLYDQFDYGTLMLDLNTADTILLMKLKGIGSVLSQRIVRYRDLLGGYHAVEQLREVYGISVETYTLIKDNLTITNDFTLRRIKINQVDVDNLAKHPYLSFKDAKLIVNYRDQHGPYMSEQDLSKIGGLSDATIAKIAPYLNLKDD